MPTNIGCKIEDITGLQRGAKLTLQEQLVVLLTDTISKGVFRAGDRLPSVRALAKQYQVSRETAKQALGTLQESGMIEILPSRGAFVLDNQIVKPQSENSGMIGVLLHVGNEENAVHDVQLIYDKLLQDLDKEADVYEQHLLTAFINPSSAEGIKRLERMLKKIDGLLVIGLYTEELLARLEDLPIPVISVLSNIDVESIDDVGCENYKSYHKATEYLIGQGCRELVYVDGPEEYYQGSRRYEGCMSAVKAHRALEVRLASLPVPGWKMEDAKAAFLELVKSMRPDGVLAVNDIMASGIIQACRDAQLSIPDDIAVIGAKNTLLAQSMDPPLASIECYFDEIAKVALERMNKRITGISYRPAKIEITGSLQLRGSCMKRGITK